MATTPPDLAPIRAQVYKDPRPEEYFDRFHERSRTREPDWVYEVVRIVTSLYAWTFFRARGDGAEKVPAQRAGDPRAEPLLVHGPLLRRRVHPPARARSWRSRSCSSRRCSGSTRHGGVFPVRRGYQDEEAFITANGILERGGAIVMYCEGGRSRTRHAVRAAQARASGGSRWSPARRSCRSRSTAPRTCATGSAAQFPKVHGALRRRDPLGPDRASRRATSSRRSRTRSSRGSRGSTRRSTTATRRHGASTASPPPALLARRAVAAEGVGHRDGRRDERPADSAQVGDARLRARRRPEGDDVLVHAAPRPRPTPRACAPRSTAPGTRSAPTRSRRRPHRRPDRPDRPAARRRRTTPRRAPGSRTSRAR